MPMVTKDPGLISFTARTSRGSFEEYDRGASALSSGIEVALRGLNPATLDRCFKPAQELWRLIRVTTGGAPVIFIATGVLRTANAPDAVRWLSPFERCRSAGILAGDASLSPHSS